MTYDDAIEKFGTQVRLAAALGITQSSVSSWNKVIPPRYQFQLEVLTRGELKTDAALLLPMAQRPQLHANQGGRRGQMQ